MLQLVLGHDGAGVGGGGWEGEVACLGRAVRVMMVSLRAARPVTWGVAEDTPVLHHSANTFGIYLSF